MEDRASKIKMKIIGTSLRSEIETWAREGVIVFREA